MSDEFPRPYSEDPPPAEPLSGFRLLQARPLAVLGTVLLTAAVLGADAWAWLNTPALSPDDSIVWRVARSFVTELPGLVPLIMIAILGGRRVRPPQALALWGAAAVIPIVDTELVNYLWAGVFHSADGGSLRYVSEMIGFVTLFASGLLARWLLPLPGRPAMGKGRDLLVLALASLLLTVTDLSGLFTTGMPIWVAVAASVSVWSVLLVGWSVAALVTSARKVSEWPGEPAELGRQDP